jgi:hypothetical protein
MNIIRATRLYEEWLGQHLVIVKRDLDQKHKNMASDPFLFFRATYYRWAQRWREVCPELADAVQVLCVADLHVENFGTWRDVDARLIWGINDFDEACVLPYTNDLLRLAASANLAIKAGHLQLSLKDACKAILRGYKRGITSGGAPFVLEEEHQFLRKMALSELRDPHAYWEKVTHLPRVRRAIPADAQAALEALMPEAGLRFRVVTRQAGQGSLGRQRFVAIAKWQGGLIAREAKALAPSANDWATGTESGGGKILYQDILSQSIRCFDPFVRVDGPWVVRRLSPDCSRIDLSQLDSVTDDLRLLEAMGAEVANVHLGTPGARSAILSDLHSRSKRWLRDAAKRMTDDVKTDFRRWRKHSSEQRS